MGEIQVKRVIMAQFVFVVCALSREHFIPFWYGVGQKQFLFAEQQTAKLESDCGTHRMLRFIADNPKHPRLWFLYPGLSQDQLLVDSKSFAPFSLFAPGRPWAFLSLSLTVLTHCQEKYFLWCIYRLFVLPLAILKFIGGPSTTKSWKAYSEIWDILRHLYCIKVQIYQ